MESLSGGMIGSASVFRLGCLGLAVQVEEIPPGLRIDSIDTD